MLDSIKTSRPRVDERKTADALSVGFGRPRFIIALIVLAGVYFLAAKFGLKLAIRNPSATAVWPPTGIALAALVLGGARYWPAIFAGAFFANATTAGTIATSIGIAFGNTAEALLGSFLVARFAGGAKAFDRPADIFRWAVFAGLLSTAVSATIGVTTLTLAGQAGRPDYGTVWLTWWLGDAGGALGVAPLLVLWVRDHRPRCSLREAVEMLALAVLLWVLAEFGFGVPFGLAPRTHPLGFAFLPPLAWAAFRWGPRETATVALGVSIVSIWGTIRAHGPFAVGDRNESLLLVQAFLAVTTTTALALAAAVEERGRAQRGLSALAEERQRALEAVRESKAQLARTEQFSLVMATHVGLDGRWLKVPPTLCELLGTSEAELLGTTFMAVTHPDDVAADWSQCQRLIRGEVKSFELEKRYVRKDGGIVWVYVNCSVVSDAQAKPVHFLTYIRDITERKRSEEARQFLAEAGEVLASSLDYASCLENVVRLVVPKVADFCTIQVRDDEQSAPRTAIWRHVSPERGRAFLELDRLARPTAAGSLKAFRSGEAELVRDVEALYAGGGLSPEHVRLNRELGLRSCLIIPLVVRGRTPGVLVLGSTADSGRRYDEKDLELARELGRRVALSLDNAQIYQTLQDFNRILEMRVAERTAELKDALTELEGFSYTVAHDLRAPLRALAGFSGVLREDYASQLDSGGREYLERISNAAHRMDDLVQDLLSYSKLAREEVRRERVDVAELIREILAQMDPELRERRATVRVEEPVPPVLAHRVMLGHALSNLIGNAVKFVAPGVAPDVRISVERRDGKVRLWVRDNGIGIAPAYHRTIFEIFQRLEPERYPGTGVGLAIVRKALDRMGGSSGVESSPNDGSRFWIELPEAPK